MGERAKQSASLRKLDALRRMGADFTSLVARRFSMERDDLRITGNDWLGLSYRHALMEEVRARLAV